MSQHDEHHHHHDEHEGHHAEPKKTWLDTYWQPLLIAFGILFITIMVTYHPHA